MEHADTSLQRLLKAEELAHHLNCGKSTVYALAKSGKIPAINLGATGVRFEINAVLEALRRKTN